MERINRKIMLVLKIFVSIVVSIIATYQSIVNSNLESILCWLLPVLFCVVNTIEYSRRDYEK